MMYADIVVNIAADALDRIFQYRIPNALIEQAIVGARVLIPFGKGNRQIEGYIIEIRSKADYPEEKIKDILSVINDGISAEKQLIRLASNIKTVYGSTMVTALKTVLPVNKQVAPVTSKHYELNITHDEAADLLVKLKKDQRMKARVRLLEYLLLNEGANREQLLNGLGISASVIKSMVDQGFLKEIVNKHYRKPIRLDGQKEEKLVLNSQQRQVVDGILEKSGQVHLLHGVTGSGKTEVYIELIEATIAMGKQVIVLIPEIALTMQTVTRFYHRFGDRVSVMNSRLSAGERYDQYLRAKDGDIDVIVGPRSALFMPFERLGLIIIDEEHDGAYKSETTPKYHAREVAIWRSKMCHATVVLGSATPSIVSYKKAKDGIYHLHTLTKRAKPNAMLPKVSIVDLREEFKLKNKKIFSQKLMDMMQMRLDQKEQTMLFLNRRGLAGFVSCRSCGYVIKCKHCDISMTAHNNGRLKCHYCGYEIQMPKICPSCGSKYIAAFGTGTQKVEQMVTDAFPIAKVLRLDKDAASKKDGVDQIISDFRDEKADVLVGTQMIVKGHDFPKVTLVGILAADLSMFSGDYMAAERTFGLLVQAAGRAGRDALAGDVVIQTYNPEHYSITTAAKQDYEGFYQQEILFRELMNYPPFCHMMAILGEGADENALELAMQFICSVSRDFNPETIEVIGPASAFVSKGKDAYRKVAYVKCKQMKTLIYLKNQLEQYSRTQKCLQKIYLQYDMDPISMY